MKSAIGNAFIVNFIIVFTIIFITLFVGSTSYTKALRIKNRITDIIEENNGYSNNSTAQKEIEDYLAEAGYRISQGNKNTCGSREGGTLVYPGQNVTSNYDYCIYKFTNSKGTYYGVKTYMYLDLPIIGDKIKIGVYGETKTIGILGG